LFQAGGLARRVVDKVDVTVKYCSSGEFQISFLAEEYMESYIADI